jgi:oligopeptide/dipeptide ABC transporter ATP-binding protein
VTGPVLEVHHLAKEFQVRTPGRGPRRRVLRAVDDVSFTLAEGETLGLVGESGCGKSTLGRSVLHLIDPDGGDVVIDGHRVRNGDDRALRRTAQLVFQDPYSSLPPKMRVGHILAEPLRIHRVVPREGTEKRVLSLLRDVGLKPDHARAFPHQLSGGQRQRVSIARALAVEPRLIVADEAVSALDVSVQAQILNLLRDLQQQHGIAYLFISHDLGVVRYMSHRIAVMYLGRIVELGAAEDVVSRPLHPYTRELLAAVPRLGSRGEPLAIESEPPSPVDPPGGCAFHPRCPIARPNCSHDRPELREWLDRRTAACHYALDPSFDSSLTGYPGGDAP